MDFSIRGKKAIVTGGANGIGKSVAEGLAKAAADVAIVDIDMDGAAKAAEQIGKLGVKAIAVQADLTKPEDVKRMAQEVEAAFGRIDICFNNAGICINEKAEEMSFDSWSRVININLTAVFLVAQAVGRVMIRQGGGSIINTASMSAHIVNVPQPQCAYNASKAGVIQLTKSLAVEWLPYRVRVNCISPGYISTAMTLSAPKSWQDEWMRLSPAERMGTPEELQGAVIYLGSDASTFTTGADILVDGAFTCI